MCQDKPHVGDALGIIETRGLIGMIEAADAMLKTANVTLRIVRFIRAPFGLGEDVKPAEPHNARPAEMFPVPHPRVKRRGGCGP